MIVPLNWLKEYIDITESPEEVARVFTSIGYMLDRPITQVEGDTVIDLEVRQNRSDCLSLLGLARELGAALGRPIKLPESAESLGEAKGKTRIDVPEPELCPRFFGLTFEGVDVKESPEWMKKRLAAYGIKSINNVVDITNYVATELGMPLHAYDADKVADRHLIIRHAHQGESLVLFGGKHVSFTEDDIIHADTDGPIGFGALMGGEEKSVHPETTSIILEAAVYNQGSVRRSSRRHNIRTEASTRLEKFIHPYLVEIALKRALKLVQELAGGTLVDTTDTYQLMPDEKKVTLHISEISRLCGIDLSIDKVSKILNSLEISHEKNSEEELTATVPYFRTDLEQEADLVEEVMRMYGYDKIPEVLPQSAPPVSIQSRIFDIEEAARDVFIAMGYDEVITEPITDEPVSALKAIMLENSLTSEKRMLRTTLQHSLQNAATQRSKFRQKDIRLFEVGKMYYMENEKYVEERVLGCIILGAHTYEMVKGDCETLLNRLGYAYDAEFVSIVPLSESSYFASISLEKIVKEGESYSSKLLSTPIQFIYHDFAFVVPIGTDVETLLGEIKNIDPLIYAAEYVSTQDIGQEGKNEYLIRVSYGSVENTLSEKDVQPIKEKIVKYSQSL